MGFLYRRFRVGTEFWEIHELVRKMILTGLLIYLPASVRPPSAIVVSLVACCTLNYYQAHKNKIVFWIAEASFILTTGKYLLIVYGMSLGSKKIGPKESKYLGYLLIGLDMSIIIGGWACVVAVFFLMRKSLELIKKEEEEKRVRLTLSNRVRPLGKGVSIIKQFTKEKGNEKQTDGNPKLNENKNEWEISTQQSAVVVVPVQKQKSAAEEQKQKEQEQIVQKRASRRRSRSFKTKRGHI